MKRFLPIICLLLGQCAYVQAQDTLSFSDVLSSALEQNYGIRLARNAAEIPAILNDRSQAGMLPTVTGSVATNYSNTTINQEFANGNSFQQSGVSNYVANSSVAAEWTVFDGMRMFIARDRLAELEKIGKTELENQIQQTLYSLTLSWYNLLRLQEQIRVTEAFIGLLEERVKIAGRAFEIGASAKTDLLQAEIDLQEQQVSLRRQQNEIANARAAINQLMGVAPEGKWVSGGKEPSYEVPGYQILKDSMLANNPQLLALKSRLAVSVLTERETRAQVYPTVALRGGANLNFSRNTAGFSLFNLNFGPYAGFAVNIPIYQAGRLRNQTELAQLDIENVRTQGEQLQLQLQTLFEQSWNDYNNTRQVAVQQAEIARLAEENADIAFALFRQRQISSVDLRQVQLVYVQAKNTEILTRFEMKQAELDLLLLSGRIRSLL
ncbi:MAG: TolC family protein [Bacteroidetes bacterium]|nr:MAG: TolC family protein [Bacteroidota bacterium]